MNMSVSFGSKCCGLHQSERHHHSLMIGFLQRAGSQFVVKNRQVSTSSPTAALRQPFGARISLEPSLLQTQRFASLKKIQTASGTKRSDTREGERNSAVTLEGLGGAGTSAGVCGCVLGGNYILSNPGSPATQTETTAELEQAAASCCLSQQTGRDLASPS